MHFITTNKLKDVLIRFRKSDSYGTPKTDMTPRSLLGFHSGFLEVVLDPAMYVLRTVRLLISGCMVDILQTVRYGY